MKKHKPGFFPNFAFYSTPPVSPVKHTRAITIALRCVAFLPILYQLAALADDRDKLPPVVTATAKRETVSEEIPLTGSAFPWRESSLSAEVDGLVLEVLVDDGDRVRKGDLLIRLDDTLARLNTEQAEAALAESLASYEESLRQLDEAAKLIEKRHIAETTYKALIADSKVKRATVDRLTAEYRRTAEIASRYRIAAPFDGIIGTRPVEIGQWTETGQAVINLFEIEKLKIRVPVPQRYYALIQPGTPVLIRFDALTEQTFEAFVSRKIPIADSDARTFPVRIDLANPDYWIAPGMSAKVLFQIQGPGDISVLTVPRDAVVTAPDGTESVWKISRGEAGFTVAAVPVRTGRLFDQSVEIVDGSIDTGDPVVVRGNEILQDGQKVRVLRAAN